jgi:hypothetical protein
MHREGIFKKPSANQTNRVAIFRDWEIYPMNREAVKNFF